MPSRRDVGVVVIGRNEGPRLIRALESVRHAARTVVYVDSGSTDNSLTEARARDVLVVELDMRQPFTAARARNAGFAALRQAHPDVVFAVFIDGDCEVFDGWISACVEALRDDDTLVAVCGIRRERYPERSIYNRICDVEWRMGEPGITSVFGGDVVIRADALAAVGGYNEKVIAAEDDELSVRLRKAGGEILRLAMESTLHDAAMTSIGQWWKRAKRCGHAYAHVSSIHGAPPERHFVSNLRRVWVWGLAVPVATIGLAVPSGGATLLLLGIYPLRIIRTARRMLKRGFSPTESWAWGVSCTFSPIPELFGAIEYYRNRLSGRDSKIIEYKGAAPTDTSK